MKQRGVFTLLVAVLLAATLILFLISFQVRANEAAIVYTFGKATRTIHQSGLYWKLPYPFQTVTKYDRRINVFEGKFQEFLTKDQNILIVTLAVGWSIQDPQLFQEKIGSRSKAEGTLAGIVAGAANAIVNSYDLDQFISTDTGRSKYGDIEKEISDTIQAEASEKYGLQVAFVRITQLELPEDVTKQVFERIRVERGSKAKDLRAQGDGKAKEIEGEADRAEKEILAKAEAEALGIRGEADKEAARHYGVFQKDPELAQFLLNLESIKKLKKRTTLILTPDTPPWTLLRPDLTIPGLEAPKSTDVPREKPSSK